MLAAGAMSAGFLVASATGPRPAIGRSIITMKLMQARQIEVGQPFPAVQSYVVCDGQLRARGQLPTGVSSEDPRSRYSHAAAPRAPRSQSGNPHGPALRARAQCTVEELFGSESTKTKVTVLVGMPGAFTPTCTDEHLPGFIRAVPRFERLGAKVAVITTND
eukprot:5770873-Prymnesium_polylepis.1